MEHGAIAAFAGLGWGLMWVVFILFVVVQSRLERNRIYDMIEKASQEGKTLPPEVFGRLRRRPRNWMFDLRTGLVLIALGLGLMISGVINFYGYHGPNSQLFYGPFKLFPIPTLIGVAFVVISFLRRGDEPIG
jgi:hypothetical protein